MRAWLEVAAHYALPEVAAQPDADRRRRRARTAAALLGDPLRALFERGRPAGEFSRGADDGMVRAACSARSCWRAPVPSATAR